MTTVISLGGSIIAPNGADTDFIKDFYNLIVEYLKENEERRVILVVGGGGVARDYQKAYREIKGDAVQDDQDWIGIMATRLNAQLVKAVFGDFCPNDVVTDPTGDFEFNGRVLLAAGWKPGFSTDNDAVLLAEKFGAKTVINLSNIAKIYTADPKVDKDATPIDTMNWELFKKLIGDEWIPGKNVPFDPVATKKAASLNLKLITASGRDLENTKKILNGDDFVGSIIKN